MLLPIEVGQLNYRESEPPQVLIRIELSIPLTPLIRPFGLFGGYAALNMSPMMRVPEVTAPGKCTLIWGSVLLLTSCATGRNPIFFPCD